MDFNHIYFRDWTVFNEGYPYLFVPRLQNSVLYLVPAISSCQGGLIDGECHQDKDRRSDDRCKLTRLVYGLVLH